MQSGSGPVDAVGDLSRSLPQPRGRLAGWLHGPGADQIGLFGALVVLCTIFAILSPYFLLPQNALNIAHAVSYTGITAAITTLVLVGGGLDLSISAVMALAGTVCAELLLKGVPWPAVIAAGLGAGVVVGLFNGAVITYVGINPLIVTIGSQFVVRGAAFLVVQNQELVITERHFLYLGQGSLLGIPVPAILMAAMFCLVGWWMRFTVFGRHMYAIGGSPGGTMARLAGIPVERRRMQMYVLSGAFAALSGIVLAGFTGTGLAYAAQGLELPIIASVILGGTALTGGRGSVLGTVIGVFVLGVVANGITLLNLSNQWQLVVQGVALLLAVIVDEVRAKRRAR